MRRFLTRKVTLPIWGRAVPVWILGLVALLGIGLAGGGGGDEEEIQSVADTSVPIEDQLPRAETATTVITSPLGTTTVATAAPTTAATAPLATKAPATTTTTATAPPTTQPPATAPPTTQASSTYYENCTAARNAGAAPVHRGDPGYGSHLDKDGDGVACES